MRKALAFIISFSLIALPTGQVQASWFIDDAYSAMEMRRLANQLFISAPAYFGITVDEITETPIIGISI